MKSLTAVTILGTFAVIALVYSVACDEMGFEENEAGVVEVQEELSTCVCRVDGEIENPGDGKTWETACQTVDECVDRLETDPEISKGCEVWVRQGSIVEGFPMDSSKLEAVGIAKNIRAYGGFKGTESRRRERIINAFKSMHQHNETLPVERNNSQVSITSDLPEVQSIDIPKPNLLDLEACGECDGTDLIVDDGNLTVDDGDLIVKGEGKFSGCGSNGHLWVGRWSYERIYMNVGDVNAYIDYENDSDNNSDHHLIIRNLAEGTGENDIRFQTSGSNRLIIGDNGNIGINTTDLDKKLNVNGTIKAEKLILDNVSADFVFSDNYDLRPLEEVDAFIRENRHLPEIPSADEFRDLEVGVGETQQMLLQKIEELTLYTIEQKKEIDALKQEVRNLKKNHGATSSR